MKRNLIIVSLIIAASLFAVSCADGGNGPSSLGTCDTCKEGTGALHFNLPLAATDVQSVTATVFQSDGVTVAATQSFAVVAGDVQGEIVNVLQYNGYIVQIDGYPDPLGPDAAVIIYTVSEPGVNVVAGATTFISPMMMPVTGDATVTATYPVGDPENANVSYVTVVPSGLRYTTVVTYYLTPGAADAVGPADDVLVGTSRDFLCKSFNAGDVQLHEGAAAGAPISSAGPNAVNCIMAPYLLNRGTINIDGTTICEPNCGAAVCGVDPVCGISCGSCKPAQACVAGACI